MNIIYHIIPKSIWEVFLAAGSYSPASLANEGYIHCSELHQLVAVGNRYFQGQNDLFVISIDKQQVQAPIVYEDSTGAGELFPHIYGSLPLNAVLGVNPFNCDATGLFHLPQGLTPE
jgi:uncharacterized protein (DUF952 family)